MIRQSNRTIPRPSARQPMRAFILAAVCAALLLSATSHAQPDPAASVMFSPGFRFVEPDGESLYRNVCSGCHMRDGRGASGAGKFPSLVENGRLEAAGYPLHVVANGLHGMPPLGMFMSDQQLADVVNYVRTHFGNTYQDAVSAADARAARQ
jgi:cytochrome c5